MLIRFTRSNTSNAAGKNTYKKPEEDRGRKKRRKKYTHEQFQFSSFFVRATELLEATSFFLE